MHNWKRIVEDPNRLKNCLRGKLRKVNEAYANWRYRNQGEIFTDEDWDYLVILDAAHPEYFEQELELPGNYERRFSAASESSGFIESNFLEKELHDTIYITANPHSTLIPDNVFYKIRNLLNEQWDAELGTVPPTAVVSTATEELDDHPDKRLILHFMQPHFPFIGEKGRGFDESAIPNDGNIDKRPGGANPWSRLRRADDINIETVLAAYRENHAILQPHLEMFLNQTSGETVITADHSNLIGGRGFPIPIREYGHPPGYATPRLRSVPWLRVSTRPRPTIRSEPPVKSERVSDSDTIENRLSALGYRDS